MTLEISSRTLLRRSFLSTLLVLSLFLAVPCLSPRAAAQQPDNDDMNRPSAEKPDKDRNKDKDKDKDRDRDKDRDEHRRRNEAQSQQATRPDNDITHRELDSFDAPDPIMTLPIANWTASTRFWTRTPTWGAN